MGTKASDLLPSGFALLGLAFVLAAGGLMAASKVALAKEKKTKPDYSALQPKVRTFVEPLNGPPIYRPSIEEAHDVLNGVQAGPVVKTPADIEDRSFPVGPGDNESVRRHGSAAGSHIKLNTGREP